MGELRFAVRGLVRQPLVSGVAILTLTLGIGASTVIFSLLYAALLAPLPYAHADRLVFIWNSYPKGGSEPSTVSIPDYLDRRAEAPAIEESALFTPRPVSLVDAGRAEPLVALAVTPSFLATLGRAPAFGTGFLEADASPGHDRKAILTDGTWKGLFGGDRSVIGRSVRIDGDPYTLVGVLPADFELPRPDAALLVPFTFTPAQRSDQERGNEFSTMIARLAPGATIARVNAEMQAIVDRLVARLPERAAFMRATGFTGIAVPIREQLAGHARRSLYLLQGAVLLVLLIACVNVANLLLMRGSSRRREMAIRLSLGASRWQVTRLLLAEAAVLSAAGASGACALALAGVPALVSLAGDQLPGVRGAAVSLPVLAFAASLASLTALAAGLAPAFAASRSGFAPSAEAGSTRASTGRRAARVRAALVAAEMALAVALLVTAGLLARGFARVLKVDPGFAPDHVITAGLSLPASAYPDAAARRGFWTRLLEQVDRVPGVSAAGLISTVPFSGALSSGTFHVAGHTLAAGERPPHARIDLVAGRYFAALRIPLREGRLLDDRDGPDTPRAVVVDERLASRQFPGASAVGRQLDFDGPRTYTIVGVVGSILDRDLAEAVPEGRIYLAARQLGADRLSLTVRTSGAPAPLAAAIRAAVQAVDPDLAPSEIRTMDAWLTRSLGSRRTPTTVLALFSAAAIALAAIGIYAVVGFSVAERRPELGIRQALGASPRHIMRLIFAQGLGTAAAGVASGLGIAAAASRLLEAFLFEVGSRDPAVFGAAAALVLAVAAVACWIPANRAANVNPSAALKIH